MPFNELNSTEYFIIHRLTGVNLNAARGNVVQEGAVEYEGVKWKYIQPELLPRQITEVFVEKELRAALCRLNPDIAWGGFLLTIIIAVCIAIAQDVQAFKAAVEEETSSKVLVVNPGETLEIE